MGVISFTSNSTQPNFDGEGALVLDGKLRDPLHDTIAFSPAEKWVIDQPEFQRLRKIQQTAFIKYVFPGATHTRFEHSLGTMHLSGVFWTRLFQNQKKLLKGITEKSATLPSILNSGHEIGASFHGSLEATRESLGFFMDPSILQTLRFAALLHDVGHAPFSHSSERFMPTWQEFSEQFESLDLRPYLKKAFAQKIQNLKQKSVKSMSQKIRHEIYTLMIISQLFRSSKDFLNDEMGQNVCAVIDKDVEPVGVLKLSGLSSLLHEIVSGELDVDRMDYLMRDSRECGVVYGLFDAGRLLDSACYYYLPQTKTYHLALQKSGVAAFEDYLRARWSMYQQVYFHKTATACEAMLEHIRKKCSSYELPLDVNEYLKLNDHTFPEVLKREIKVHTDSSDPRHYIDICDDLFDLRKLWKRVFEENSSTVQQARAIEQGQTVLKWLQEEGIPCELIESRTSLTRFSPKGRNLSQQNSLKVVVKDHYGLSYLELIENLSPLVNQTSGEDTSVRVFVSLKSEDRFESSQKLTDLRRLISQQIYN
jgi:uncharacterized protein